MTSTPACQLRPCCTPPANRRLLSRFRNRFRTLMSMATIDVSFRFYLECRYRSVWAQTTQRGDMKRVDHGSRYRHPQCKRRASQSARAFFSSECINICRCHLFFFSPPAESPSSCLCPDRFPNASMAWLGDGMAWRCSHLHVEEPSRREPSTYHPQPLHGRNDQCGPGRAEPCDREDMESQTKATPATLSDAQ